MVTINSLRNKKTLQIVVEPELREMPDFWMKFEVSLPFSPLMVTTVLWERVLEQRRKMGEGESKDLSKANARHQDHG